MAQTQTRPRGQSSTQQQAPREAPQGNVPATRPQPQQQAAGGGTRGMTQAQRGTMAMANFREVMAQFSGQVDSWSRGLFELGRSQQEVSFFKEVLLTAVAEKPDLVFADRRTFFNSARKCFLDGCLPDGRDAALVVYKTKIKVRDQEGIDVEATIDAVQYMPMVQGIRRKMLESGFVTFAFADAVYKLDNFRHIRGLHASIEHEAPPMGADRGPLIGAYAIIKLSSGEVLLDSMAEKEILASKAKSRAQGGMLWTEFPHEAFKKTVFRRLSKSAPVSPNIRRLVDREDEPADGEIDDAGTMRSPGPRFEYASAYTVQSEPEPPVDTAAAAAGSTIAQSADAIEVSFDVVNLDGEVNSFGSAFRAFDAVVAILDQAANLGLARIDGFWESNQDALDAFSAGGHGNLSAELAQRYTDARDAAEEAERKRDAERAATAERDEAARKANATTMERKAKEEAERQAAADIASAQQRESDEGGPPAQEGDPGPGVADAGEHGGAGAPGAGEAPFPGDLPNKSELPPPATAEVQPGMPAPITVPLKAGKLDHRTFAIALLAPKIRATKSSADLAMLLGANEAALEKCRSPGTLSKDDLQALETTIKAQFAKLPADS